MKLKPHRLAILIGIVMQSSLYNQTIAETVTRSFTPLTSTPEQSLTMKGEIVMVELFKEIGLEFKPSKKPDIPPPRPTPNPAPQPDIEPPTPEPAPTPPTPAPAPKDDFFSSDDDFFKGSSNFDDIVKEFDKEFEDTVSAWDKEYEQTIARWGLAKKEFKKKEQQYIQATYDLNQYESQELLQSAPLAASSAKRRPSKPGEYHVIPYAFTQRMQDQAQRGTCAAFAGIRAVETLLSQTIVNPVADIVDLSEQHFFYLSRPKCIESPCKPALSSNGRVQNDGSNFDVGFTLNKKVKHIAAPLIEEKHCRYRPTIGDNVSYSPIESYCETRISTPRYRVANFSTQIPLHAIRTELDANRPVAAGFKLPSRFSRSTGLVNLVDPSTGVGSGKHDGGHALALIGYIMLPQKLWATEGKYCVITANSWGEGWGTGGYGCLTEKWMEKFYINKFATSISRVDLIKL